LGMGMRMNFFCEDGYGIVKPVLAPPRCYPYSLVLNSRQQNIKRLKYHLQKAIKMWKYIFIQIIFYYSLNVRKRIFCLFIQIINKVLIFDFILWLYSLEKNHWGSDKTDVANDRRQKWVGTEMKGRESLKA